jgi:cobalt/nickel transport system permease protein
MSEIRSHNGTGMRRESLAWLERTLSDLTGAIERAVFTEELARKDAWLQKIDPRAKLVMFLVMVLTASLSHTLVILIALYLVTLLAAYASRLPFDFFVRRVWIGVPLFAGLVIMPSIFLTKGPLLFEITAGPLHLGPTLPGLMGATIFVARVGVSVSLAVLLVLTTPWADLLKSLQALRVPQVFILLLSMTYRYIFLFLHTANGMLAARKSRTVGHTSGNEHRSWISGSIAALMHRSFKMSNDVYAAMAARGFNNTIRTYHEYHMKTRDWLALLGACCIAAAALLAGGYLR